jgi:CubicO group peptidase (beta-lactamase class C family)
MGAATSTSTETGFSPLREMILARMAELRVPSVVVAASVAAETVVAEGFGEANRETSAPATPDAMYYLASVTKPMTATAVMILAKRGVLDLDRPVNDYLGGDVVWSPRGDEAGATLRRLLSHSAGLPTHWTFFYPEEIALRPDPEESIRRYGVLVSPPGERYRYANLGYGIAQQVIARVSGSPYAAFMRDEVFAPLGMRHASVELDPEPPGVVAERYAPDGQPFPFITSDHVAAGSVWCSAHDLLRFGRFHLKRPLPDQRPILPATAIDAMQCPAVDTAGDLVGDACSLGWFIQRDRHGVRIVGHPGGSSGASTILWLLPDHDIVVVVLMNVSEPKDFGPARVADEVLAALMPDYRRRLNEARVRRGPGAASSNQLAPGPAMRGNWRGHIRTHEGSVPLALSVEADRVHAALAGRSPLPLEPGEPLDGAIVGRLRAELRTADAVRRRHLLELNLDLRGESLVGAATTMPANEDDFPDPTRREANALGHWVELRRDNGGIRDEDER